MKWIPNGAVMDISYFEILYLAGYGRLAVCPVGYLTLRMARTPALLPRSQMGPDCSDYRYLTLTAGSKTRYDKPQVSYMYL